MHPFPDALNKYLYLNEVAHARTWIEGGIVPLSLASKYRSEERAGTMTPDENGVLRIRRADEIAAFRTHNDQVEARNIRWLTRRDDGTVVEMAMDIGYVDGLVVCLSNGRNDEIWAAVGKKACVAIADAFQLYMTIDRLLDDQDLFTDPPPCVAIARGRHARCEYTDTAQREVFLKSALDAWQDEYRLFWHTDRAAQVLLPGGLAELVWPAAE
jgi:hypothetical protein